MYSVENDTLRKLTIKAQKMGYYLSKPEKDMYGRYECTIEEIATGTMSVTMNHQSAVDAAIVSLSQVSMKNEMINGIMNNKINVKNYELEGA